MKSAPDKASYARFVTIVGEDGKPLASVWAHTMRSGLAITPAYERFSLPPRRWCVTHIKSGARLNPGERGLSLAQAGQVLEAFLALPIDWTLTRSKVVREAGPWRTRIGQIREASRLAQRRDPAARQMFRALLENAHGVAE